MKPQVILFALLRAQAALSDEGSPAMLPDCASPCKTNLRAGASKLSECVRSRCGAPVEMEEEGENVARSPNACVARCLKLRFGRARQEQCIKDCNQDEEDGGRSVPNDAEEGGEHLGENDAQSPNACVSRCLKLRFGPARQEQCIKDCDREEEDGGRSVPGAEAAEYDAEEDKREDLRKNDAQSPNTCVARCLKLRFGPARQEQCTKDCDRNEEDGDRSVPDSEAAKYGEEEEGEEFGESVAQSPNACVARCLKLRFGPARKEQCLKDCKTEEDNGTPVVKGSKPEEELANLDAEEEGGDASENTAQSLNACVARCLRLRFSAARQKQCIADCGREGRSSRESISDDVGGEQAYAATA